METFTDFEYESRLSPSHFRYTSNQDISQYEIFSKIEILINWVNSFEYPNCLLASDISDFKDGIIFCELTNEIILNNQIPDFLPKIVSHSPNYEEKLHNVTMALSEIKSTRNLKVPSSVKEIKSDELLQDEAKIVTLLNFLYDIANNPESLQINDDKSVIIQANGSLQSTLDKNHPNDLFYNRSDFYSNNSTQPSPLSNIHGIKQQSHKPPLNPIAYKSKSPTNFIQPRKQAQSPRQHEESLMPAEFKRREPYLYAEEEPDHAYIPVESYTRENNRQNKQPLATNHQYFSAQTRNKICYEEELLYPQSYSTTGLHHQEKNHEISVDDFLNPEAEVPRSVPPNENVMANRDKTYNKNSLKSGSKYEVDQHLTQNKYGGYFDQPKNDHDYQYQDLEKRVYMPPSDLRNEPHFFRDSYRSRESSSVNTAQEHDESRILPAAEVQRRSSQNKKRSEEFDYEDIARSQPVSNEVVTYHKKKSKSQSHYPSPEVLEVKPAVSINPAKRIPKKSDEKEIIITPASSETKAKLLNWLCTIGLLKDNIKGIDKKLPRVCRNGLLFVDIINKLEGKNEVIRGINRSSKSRSQVNSNYLKVLEYLRSFEKANPRYLQAQEYLIEGNEEVFWGFLDDIWHLYNKKISPFDPRYKLANKPKIRASTPTRKEEVKINDQSGISNPNELSYNDICCYNNYKSNQTTGDSNSPTGNRNKIVSFRDQHTQILEKKTDTLADCSPIHQLKENVSYNFKEEQVSSRNKESALTEHNNQKEVKIKENIDIMEIKTDQLSYSPINKKNVQRAFSPTPASGKSNRRATNFSVSSPSYIKGKVAAQDNKLSNEDQYVSIDIEILVTEWLKQIGFKALLMRERRTLFDDPFRNGSLLCYVVGRVENERMNGMYKEPKSIDECRSNVYKAFQILRRRHTPIPSFLNGREEAVLRGDRSVTLTLLYSLMKLHKSRTEPALIPNPAEKGNRYEPSSYIPPYSEAEIEQLEQSLINWIDSLGLLQDVNYKPSTIRELTNYLKSGVMLCDLTSIVIHEKLGSIHRRPTTELHYLTNIRKALEALRGMKGMGQKYLWKDKEIYKGNKYVILGLLEDMHRYYDDYPSRKNPNYFVEGPYLPGLKPANSHRLTDTRDETAKERSKLATYEQAFKNSLSGRLNMSDHQDKYASNNKTNANNPISTSYFVPNLVDDNKAKHSLLNISADEPISLIYDKRTDLDNSLNVSGVFRQERSTKASDKRSSAQPQYEVLKKGLLSNSFRSSPHSRKDYISEPHSGSTIRSRSPLSKQTGFYPDTPNRSQILTEKNISQGTILREWLFSIGLTDLVRDIDFDVSVIQEMRDGVILSKILEKLEMKEIPGVIVRPRTKASQMVNVRKCMNVLSKRPGVNPHYLHSEDKILAGDGETIRRILFSIKDAYKFVNRCIAKSGSRSSSKNLDSSTIEQRRNDYDDEAPNTYGTRRSINQNIAERKRMLIPTPKSKY